MPSLVEIVITVTQFKAKTSPGRPARQSQESCTIETALKLAGANARATGSWKHDSSSQVFLCPLPDAVIENSGIIAVRQQGNSPVEFTFTIASAPGALPPGLSALRPIAIEFEQQPFHDDSTRPLTDPNGAKNFAVRGFSGSRLTLADNFSLSGPSRVRIKSQHAAPFWKFWIRVEATAANGATVTGWIDPTIENSDDMAV